MRAVSEHGGVMTTDDLNHHHTELCDPITTTYRGYNVYEVPPPTAVSFFGPHSQEARSPEVAYSYKASELLSAQNVMRICGRDEQSPRFSYPAIRSKKAPLAFHKNMA